MTTAKAIHSLIDRANEAAAVYRKARRQHTKDGAVVEKATWDAYRNIALAALAAEHDLEMP